MAAGAAQRMTARVVGRVHGVGYRVFAQREAARRGLRGYVRNLPDGSVELVAEGAPPLLDQLIEALHHGPPAAVVAEVEVHWSAAQGEFTRFQIRH